jgi:hypothetical protein
MGPYESPQIRMERFCFFSGGVGPRVDPVQIREVTRRVQPCVSLSGHDSRGGSHTTGMPSLGGFSSVWTR